MKHFNEFQDPYERTSAYDSYFEHELPESNTNVPLIDKMLNDAIIETYTQARYTDQVKVADLIRKIKLKYGLIS